MSSYFDTSYFKNYNNYTSGFYGNLFGSMNSASGSSSLFSSLGDLTMINNGTYKKALKAYYAKAKQVDETETKSTDKSTLVDSKENLSNLKSAATDMKLTANALKNKDFSKVEKPEDVLDSVKEFVSDYNSMLNASKKINSYSILQTAVWGTDQMNASEMTLNKAGISINADNTLSIDEEKFKEASVSTLKALFSGSNSLSDRIAAKASALAVQSANQLSVNAGRSLYNASGVFS